MNSYSVIHALAIFAVVAAGPATAQQEDVSDARGLVTLSVPEGWRAAADGEIEGLIRSRENPGARILGVDLDMPGIAMIREEWNGDLIPVLQAGVIDVGGLSLSNDSIDELQRSIETVYSEHAGTPFRMFLLERDSLNGLQAVRLTGVYRWRTNNIKILQYLVPGGGHLYALTYTAQEREFNQHLPAVQESLASLRIADPPLFVGPLWEMARWVLLIGVIVAVVWGIFYASSIKPDSGRPGFSVMGLVRRVSVGDSDRSNPFMRKK